MKSRANPLSSGAEQLLEAIRELELDEEELLPPPEVVRELELQRRGNGEPVLPELGNEDLVLPILNN